METLEIELKEKVVSLSNLQKELEQEKVLCCLVLCLPSLKQFKIYVHTFKPAHKRCSCKYNILRLFGCIWTFVPHVGAKIVRFDTNF